MTEPYIVYYVALNGDDITGDGSVGNPWKTLVKAIASIPIAGNCRIWVANGTYAENGTVNALFLARTFLAEVVIQPLPTASVIIMGNGTNLGAVAFGSNAQNITFDGQDGSLTIQSNTGESYPVWFTNNAVNIASIKFNNLSIVSDVANASLIFTTNNIINGLQFNNCTLTATGAGNSNGLELSSKTGGEIQNVTLNNLVVHTRLYGVKVGAGAEGHVNGLTITGGCYTVDLTNGASLWLGSAKALTLTDVKTRGNGTGIYIKGLVDYVASPVTLTNCDVNAVAGKRTGLHIDNYVSNVLISGGKYDGGLAGGGEGGIYVNGLNNTALEIANADISSTAPDPITNRVLACGIAGVDGIHVHHCRFHGNGRAITLQDMTLNAVIEYNTSDAEDMAFRVGHNATGEYTTNNVIYRYNISKSTLTPAIIIGEGAKNVTIENNNISGANGFVYVRGSLNMANVLIQNNTFVFLPGQNSNNAAFEFDMAQCVKVLNNIIDSHYLQAALLTSSDGLHLTHHITLTGNIITQTSGKVFGWQAIKDGGNNVVDNNHYNLTLGAILGDPISATTFYMSVK